MPGGCLLLLARHVVWRWAEKGLGNCLSRGADLPYRPRLSGNGMTLSCPDAARASTIAQGKTRIAELIETVTSVGRSSVGRSSVGLGSVGLGSIGRGSVGRSSVGRSSVGRGSVGLWSTIAQGKITDPPKLIKTGIDVWNTF